MRPQSRTVNLTNLVEEGAYKVPPYQRLYSWESDQIQAFFDSLAILVPQERIKKLRDSEVFFGPVVVEESSRGKFGLVDGQQRFTTFVLLFAAARAFVAENYEEARLDNGSTFDSWAKDALTKRGQVIPFLQANRSLAPVFDMAIYKGAAWTKENFWASEAPKAASGIESSVAQVRKNLAQLKLLLSELVHTKFGDWPKDSETWSSPENQKRAGEEVGFLHAFLQNVLGGCYFLVIQVENTEQALELFSSLNDRGLSLAPADIIKAEIFEGAVVGKNADLAIDNFESNWDTIVSNLDGTTWDVNRFLRHWCMTTTGKRVVMNGVVKAVQSQMKLLGSASRVLEELNRASSEYRKILYPHTISDRGTAGGYRDVKGSLQRMNLLGDYHRILIPKIMGMEKVAPGDKYLLIRQIENYVARSAFAGTYPQERENLFTTLAGKIHKNTSLGDAKATLSLLFKPREKAEFPTDLEFMTALQVHSSEARKLDKKTRYAILLYAALHETAHAKQVCAARADIEHLGPQSPKISGEVNSRKSEGDAAASYWYETLSLELPRERHTREYVSLVNELGNLTVLENYINQSIQDSVWPVKISGKSADKHGIVKSTFRINGKLKRLKESDLSKDWIENRTSEIINFIVEQTKQRF